MAMWIKLINAGLSSKIITIIKAIYNKISASVKLSHDISFSFDICLGLKQGEPLSPLLFVPLFISEGLKEILHPQTESILTKFVFSFECLRTIWYCFSESLDELQTRLDKLYQYTTDCGLKINTVKTSVNISKEAPTVHSVLKNE